MLVPIIDSAASRIAVVGTGLVLIASKDLLSFAVGVEVAAMLCVAVAVTCCGKSFAIVVYDHRAVDDFIASVPVHVGDAEVVVSFAEPWAARFIVEPPPTLHQFVGFRIHIVGNHLVARVDAACQKDARMAAVQIRRTEKELVGAVAVTVAPCGVQVRFAILQPFEGELHGRVVQFGCGSLHIYKVFLARHGIRHVCCVQHAVAVVFGRVADYLFCPVRSIDYGAVHGAHQQLRLSVFIPIKSRDVGFHFTCTDHIGADVYLPQPRAVQLVSLEECECAVVFRIEKSVVVM